MKLLNYIFNINPTGLKTIQPERKLAFWAIRYGQQPDTFLHTFSK